MSEQELLEILDQMKPEDAASALGAALKRVFRLLNDEARLDFIKDVVGESGEDKVSSMVHL